MQRTCSTRCCIHWPGGSTPAFPPLPLLVVFGRQWFSSRTLRVLPAPAARLPEAPGGPRIVRSPKCLLELFNLVVGGVNLRVGIAGLWVTLRLAQLRRLLLCQFPLLRELVDVRRHRVHYFRRVEDVFFRTIVLAACLEGAPSSSVICLDIVIDARLLVRGGQSTN